MLTMTSLAGAYEDIDAERIDLERMLAKLKALPLHHSTLKIVPSNHEVVPPALATVQEPTAWIDSNILVWPHRQWQLWQIRWNSAVAKLALKGADLTHYALDGRKVNAMTSGLVKTSAIGAVSELLTRIAALKPKLPASPSPSVPSPPPLLPVPAASGRPWWHYALGGVAGVGALVLASKLLKEKEA